MEIVQCPRCFQDSLKVVEILKQEMIPKRHGRLMPMTEWIAQYGVPRMPEFVARRMTVHIPEHRSQMRREYGQGASLALACNQCGAVVFIEDDVQTTKSLAWFHPRCPNQGTLSPNPPHPQEIDVGPVFLNELVPKTPYVFPFDDSKRVSGLDLRVPILGQTVVAIPCPFTEIWKLTNMVKNRVHRWSDTPFCSTFALTQKPPFA